MSKSLAPTKFSLVLFQNDVDVVVKTDKARDILGCMKNCPGMSTRICLPTLELIYL